MKRLSRRDALHTGTAAAATWLLTGGASSAEPARQLHIATFEANVTPPVGHSLCGGWIKPVEAVDDPLWARGFVLLGAGKPIVVCAVDWTGILNSAHVQWRTALAEAAQTTPDRVAVQCVHQHNAPFACVDAERIVLAQGDLPHIVDQSFFRRCLDEVQSAVRRAVPKARPVTHVAAAKGKVDKVASNRRVFRDANNKVKKMRGSSCRNKELIALPEGLIDPWLRTVAFYDGAHKIAACHYYATHPMSFYGDGRVSSDFVGLARRRIQQEQPDCLHVYFTGCAGNIAAGKYNDGGKAVRPLLTQRIYDGMKRAESELKPRPISKTSWRTVDLVPKPRATFSAEALLAQISDKKARVVQRNRPSYMLAWLQRLQQQTPILLSCLQVDDVQLLHLPAEAFVQYQLRAQKAAGNCFIATAAYGDGGPWYIPTREEYPAGGYEVSVAFCDPSIDDMLSEGVNRLLQKA